MNEEPIAAGSSSFDLVDTGKLLEKLNLKKDEVFLDLGCGNGLYSIAVASKVKQVLSVDLWEEGIDILNERIGKKDIENISTAVSDVSRNIPFDEHSVDIAFLSTVLHDLIEDDTFEGTMRELMKVMKMDSRLAVLEFNKEDKDPGPPVKIKMSPAELKKVLTPYSFKETMIASVGTHHYLSLFRRT